MTLTQLSAPNRAAPRVIALSLSAAIWSACGGSDHFGLPGCTLSTVAATASLPLSAAPTSGCTFSIVDSTTSGAMTAAAPAYDSGWATEIALDVQWAHATAPQSGRRPST